LTDVAKLMDTELGSDELPLALAELEARSPFWRRGMRRLRQLGRDFRSSDLSLTLSEAKGAPALWRELAALTYPEQLVAADTDERFETWGLCRFLQCRSVEIAGGDPEAAARLATLAVRICRRLKAGYDPALLPDYQALSLCSLGNAWRALGELHSASDAFDMAEALRRAKRLAAFLSAHVALARSHLACDLRQAQAEPIAQIHQPPQGPGQLRALAVDIEQPVAPLAFFDDRAAPVHDAMQRQPARPSSPARATPPSASVRSLRLPAAHEAFSQSCRASARSRAARDEDARRHGGAARLARLEREGISCS